MRSQSLFALAGSIAAVSAQSISLSTPTLGIPTSIGFPTLSNTGPISTNLPDLVRQLPRCAVECLAEAAEDINCNPGDFNCLCRNAQDLVTRLGPCVLLSSDCSDQDKSRAAEIAPQICAAINLNPDPSQVASASNIVTSAVATGGAATQTPNAAAQPELSNIGLGVVGLLAAWAAAM